MSLDIKEVNEQGATSRAYFDVGVVKTEQLVSCDSPSKDVVSFIHLHRARNATMPRGTRCERGISSNSTRSTLYTQARRGRRSAPRVQQQPSAVPLPTPPATSQPGLASQRIADLSLQGLVSVVRAIVQEDRAVAALPVTTTTGGTPPSGSTSVALSGSTPLPLLTSASPVTSSLAHPGTSGGLPESSGVSVSWSTPLLTSTLPVTSTLTSGGFPGSSGGMC